MGSSISTPNSNENVHDNIETLAERLNHLIDQTPWKMCDMLKIIGILGESTPDEKLQLFNAGVVDRICKLIKENNNIEGIPLRSGTATTKRKRQQNSPSKNDDKTANRGVGYGRGSTKPVWDIERTVEERIAQEEHLMWLICSLTAFLWGDALKLSEVNADYLTTSQAVHLVEDSLVPMILDTSLLSLLEYHLNNDSILDVSQHLDFYQALIELTAGLALIPAFLPYLVAPKDPESKSIAKELLTAGLALIPAFLPYLVAPKDPESKSIAKELVPKFRDALNSYMNNEKLPVSPDFTLVDFIQRINDLAELVLKCARKYETDLPPEKRVKTAHPLRRRVSIVSEVNASKNDVYKNTLGDLQVQSYKLIDEQGLPIFTQYYKKELKGINPIASSNRERNRRIAKELATMTSALPLEYGSSIFVCTDESRVDLMKVLITGPEDTPYANGLFEFDVFFPANYPNVPPKCNFLTTGGGSVRFNPNLYADGKVCLSILGTWEGRPEEKWNPLCSALQVLISIQALILVKFPYFNEPGFERQQGTSRGDEASRKYNLNIEQATLIHALYEQFKHPPPYFRDVIMRHFWLKKDDIIAQAEKWLSVNKVPTYVRSLSFEPGTPVITTESQSPIRKLIQELKTMVNPMSSLLDVPKVASTSE
uniref:UBC core domain-containing protein n=1 Tax=Panagrolaimus sp. JU765 TaxID=591449 RepID=A0AC34QZQ9_9BILA